VPNPDRPERERAAAKLAVGWLDTVGVDTVATIAESPSLTIIPTVARATSGTRALALLAEIAQREANGAVELRVGEVIAEGGMGVIRAAEQVALARQVAVKTLKPSRSDASGALDLLREAWISGSLEHPNIVPVHHLGADANGMPLLVLKRIAGVEWSALRANADEVERRFGGFARMEPRHSPAGPQRRAIRAQPRCRASRSQAEQRDDRRLRRGLPARLGNRGQHA
jgi:hypothetical protein